MRPNRSRTRTSKKSRSVALASGAVGLGVAALAPSAHAATFNVTDMGDSGPGTLRQAIIDANNNIGPDVVTFDASLSGTITLTTGQLYVSDDVDIQGPGAATISVSGNDSSRVFYLYNSDTEIDVRIAGLTIRDGSGTLGGGIVNIFETLTIEDAVLTENAALEGGALGQLGFLETLTIRNTTISGNVAADDGGGIYLYGNGPVTIEDSLITGNEAGTDGGGIYLYRPFADVTIRNTTISGNTASYGGGLFLYDSYAGPVTVEDSTISGNSANVGAGLFFYRPADLMLLQNSTISGNEASNVGGGVFFLYSLYGAGLALNFATVANNTATNTGGGLMVIAGDVAVDNSIIADNTAGSYSDVYLYATAYDFNTRFSLIEVPDPLTVNDIEGNIFEVDPQLGSLADNGGPTETHRPDLASPVINAADPAITEPLTDQRGEPREYPTIADMGAVELVGGVIQFDPLTYSVAENGGSVTLTVVRDVGPDEATVEYTTNAGTATPGAGNDYTTTTGTLTFAPGDLSETINVPILDDATAEGSEQFTVTLSDPSLDASLGAGDTATVTITDFEEGQLVFSSPTYSVNESGAGFVTITVNRVGGTDGAASVNYATSPGSATAGNDYSTVIGTLNWADGDATPQTFDVPILDDNLAEGDEAFSVTLDTPVGATIGSPGAATVTIVDDPTGTAQFSVAVINTNEETTSVTVTVTRTGGTEGSLSVNYTTADGSATAPSDYIPAAGVVTFPAGDATPQTFNIGLVDDAVEEPAESFTVTLSGADVGSPATVTINLAASDAAAAVAAVPTLSWWGRMVLMLMSALAGLYVMVRNRFSMFLIGLLALGIAAGGPIDAEAQARGRNAKDGFQNPRKQLVEKYEGKVQSVENTATNLVLTLTDGRVVTVPKAKARIVQRAGNRGTRPRPGTSEQITAGMDVRVKFIRDRQGNLKEVKVKITG